MKHIKLFEYYDSGGHRSVGRILRTKMSGVFYHGSFAERGEGIFHEFEFGYSDYDAIWFTTDENIAKSFSNSKSYDENVKTIYRMNLKIDKIADINYEQSQRILDEWELYDFRESIDILKEKGFNGWKTPGSIEYDRYDDYAIFYKDLIPKSTDMEIKMMLDGNWTEYMSLVEAGAILEKRGFLEEPDDSTEE